MSYPSKYNTEAVVIARAFAGQARPFPSMGKLAKRLGIDRRTVYRWRHKHTAFDLALQAIEARQLHWQHQITTEQYRERLKEIDREFVI